MALVSGCSGRSEPCAGHRRQLAAGASCLVVSANGRTVFVGTVSGELEVYSLGDDRRVSSALVSVRTPVTALSLTGSGDVLLVGTNTGKVYRYSSDLKKLDNGEAHSSPILSILPAGDGKSYRSGSVDGLSSWTNAGVFRPTRGRVHWIVPLADNGFAASEEPGRVIVWHRGWRHLVTGDVGDVRAGAATRDGKTLFTAGADGIVRSWQIPDDLPLHATWSGITALTIGIQPDGQRVVVSSPPELLDYFGSPAKHRLSPVKADSPHSVGSTMGRC